MDDKDYNENVVSWYYDSEEDAILWAKGHERSWRQIEDKCKMAVDNATHRS